jgi:hypothetical protein
LPGHPEFTSAFDAGLKGAALPPGVTARFPEEAERRFAVYRNNVAVSLSEALSTRFPVIRRLVGDAFFAAMARVYAETHRPASPVLLDWGGTFPAFLAGFPPLAAYPYMADVARIEVARGQAFHAADGVPARPECFAGADPARLRLVLHPSVRVLRLSHPGVSIWACNQPGEDARSFPLAGKEIALVLRDRAFNVPVFAISAGDAEMLAQIRLGASLTAAAESAREADADHRPEALILRLMQAGAILDPTETR